ncbi:2-phosphosulfolactate phosphatase [Virgibacillus subterraneus]|uniref:Probable 2-phosphosulfolactate phosphatase n=1 Tax=Virgibacillus subterraneus TaxID=621109 RepID=A0A1H8Z7I8_9BACI|nr:2-phosphosulfolactate phosphatase [Virgibacillus subterraneus]SEP60346.1 2-phosphosulfolactate phosphatase [Virgibacillus subterraneus]
MKVHLLWKKEEIDDLQLKGDKIAVVFDVLLATSTIATCLAYGAKQVTPVLNEKEALKEAEAIKKDDVCLVGERDGITIKGFLDPVPLFLKNHIAGKKVVLSTTNGTVAIRKAASAKKVYMASLLNGEAVARRLIERYDNESIVIVCSGSNNSFCIEDFYGAGYFIDQLVSAYSHEQIDLTDSAMAAKLFYENLSDQAENVLQNSRVGKMMAEYGVENEVEFVSRKGLLSVVPRLFDGKTIVAED